MDHPTKITSLPCIIKVKCTNRFMLITSETWVGKADSPTVAYYTDSGGIILESDCIIDSDVRAFQTKALRNALEELL